MKFIKRLKAALSRVSWVFSSRPAIALLVAAITFCVCNHSLEEKVQLRAIGGMAEEYYRLGEHLHTNDRPYWKKDVPFMFRPPGYYTYIAKVLDVRALLVGDEERPADEEDAPLPKYESVLFSQGVLLSLTSMIFFIFLSTATRRFVAFSFSLVFGCNPYSVILVGYSHYPVLHMFLTVLSCAVLWWSFKRDRVSRWRLTIAGAFWGVTTLTRPMTLILPGFALLFFYMRTRRIRRSLVLGAAFVLGMVIVLAPYTLRNYRVSGEFVPVNCQMGTSLWASTEQRMEPNPNHFLWWDIWGRKALPLVRQAMNNKKYTYENYVEHNIQIERLFRKKAIENIKNQPEVYLYNFVGKMKSFSTEINSVFIKVFLYQQQEGKFWNKKLFRSKKKYDFFQSPEETSFVHFIDLLSVLSLLGLMVGFKRRSAFIGLVFSVYACFCVAHALTYLDMMYYYIKVPFLVLCSAYFAGSLGTIRLRLGGRLLRAPLGSAASAAILLFCAYLCYRVIG